MASIRLEMTVAADPAKAWDAVRDVGAIHTRLAPDFVSDVSMEGEAARIVTFRNGMVARELIVDVDDAARRLVWSVVGGRMTHHNGALQIVAEPAGSRVIWVADILPHDLKAAIQGMMQQGMDAMKKKLDAA
ncbi:MAG: SRPBCC family protein [Alphaproteobacteria bacterium]|nr:SRPBCC family protein [Alphaproteobacteria bacterium]